jgi:uncharacterized repeat protein (TIGR03803 family)
MVRTIAVRFALACAAVAGAPAQATSYKVLHVFLPGTGGNGPRGNLALVGRTLFGITQAGGTSCGSDGCGTVFSINPSTAAEHVVHTFGGNGDGVSPSAGLVNVGGTLYGTTFSSDGGTGFGTVYSIDPTTKAEKILYAFGSGSDGRDPAADLIYAGGLLYGTTSFGGTGNCGEGCGTIFSLNPTTGAEHALFSFPGSTGGYPQTGLIDLGGRLFGTTFNGGDTSFKCPSGCGMVFRLGIKSGDEKLLHSFKYTQGGAHPEADLIKVANVLYGTTFTGGSSGNGTVFRLDPGNGAEQAVYSLRGGNDGGGPEASLTYVGDTLYGTTWTGGGATNCENGCGTIFAVNPATGNEQVVYRFQGGTDGARALGGLINLHGTLYGTTYLGGSAETCGTGFANEGCGTVFAFTP